MSESLLPPENAGFLPSHRQTEALAAPKNAKTNTKDISIDSGILQIEFGRAKSLDTIAGAKAASTANLVIVSQVLRQAPRPPSGRAQRFLLTPSNPGLSNAYKVKMLMWLFFIAKETSTIHLKVSNLLTLISLQASRTREEICSPESALASEPTERKLTHLCKLK
ncbi:hypothetical protein PtA15_5A847 [Puccinia triticina]|uniref:Uncharacterized protein n=1 Tax=Puccinia triticina TaxID=208348 RepID=A0ABY7CRB6_9BASI|nr:uncharacterized protein PtA15_5A847 [Puccinia triticina]WAQ85272.1 hypothetical protein PtA15_5A847 [Puccinia triticina]